MIDLEDRPAWLYELNPAGRVPVLESDGWALPESVVINEFLEERYPEPPLLPADPERAGRRSAPGLPRRRLHQALLRPPAAAGRRRGGVRGRARRPRRDARRRSVPDGRGVRSRRHRARAVGDPGPRHARRLARAVPARRRLARAPRRAAVDRRRDRASWPGCERRPARRARAAARRGRASSCSTCARPASSPAQSGYPCDARQGHVPGARNVDLQLLLAAADAEAIRALVGAPEGAEVIAYCHSGGRSAMAAQLLAGRGLRRAELRRLVARVVGEPRPAGRVLAPRSTARRRGTRCRAGGRSRSRCRDRGRSSRRHRGGIRQLRLALDEPVVEHVARHLGVELHAPGALAEAVGLAGGVVLGEELGAGGKLEVVVVPLERLEPGAA